MYTSPLSDCMCSPLNPGLCWREAGRGEGYSSGRMLCATGPQCSRARDTFFVITCRHVSMESCRFSHCFLSGLIWWMHSGTQHISLETSWKSGGHWRHLKGLSEACLYCPGNVFHWGCLLFSFAFLLVFLFILFLVRHVFVHYNLLLCKALSLVILLICNNNKIVFTHSLSISGRSLRSGCKPQYYWRMSKLWLDWKIKEKMDQLHFIWSPYTLPLPNYGWFFMPMTHMLTLYRVH